MVMEPLSVPDGGPGAEDTTVKIAIRILSSWKFLCNRYGVTTNIKSVDSGKYILEPVFLGLGRWLSC